MRIIKYSKQNKSEMKKNLNYFLSLTINWDNILKHWIVKLTLLIKNKINLIIKLMIKIKIMIPISNFRLNLLIVRINKKPNFQYSKLHKIFKILDNLKILLTVYIDANFLLWLKKLKLKMKMNLKKLIVPKLLMITFINIWVMIRNWCKIQRKL